MNAPSPAQDGPVFENGTVLTHSRVFTAADIEACARLTGDLGVQHTAGLAGRPIAQGLLTVMAAPLLRGDHGFHLRSMTLTFLAPVYVGDMVTAQVTLGDVKASPGDTDQEMSLDLVIRNQNGVTVLCGRGRGYLDNGSRGYLDNGRSGPSQSGPLWTA